MSDSFNFSQDADSLSLQIRVYDANGNLITPMGGHWSTSSPLLTIAGTSNGGTLVILEHAIRNQTGNAQLMFQADGGIQHTIDINVVAGAPTTYEVVVV